MTLEELTTQLRERVDEVNRIDKTLMEEIKALKYEGDWSVFVQQVQSLQSRINYQNGLRHGLRLMTTWFDKVLEKLKEKGP